MPRRKQKAPKRPSVPVSVSSYHPIADEAMRKADPMVARYAYRVVSLRDGKVSSDEKGEAAELSCDEFETI